MPRKTASDRRRRPGPTCFNEAAARCRGKRAALPPSGRGRLTASMRPRPDAAENVGAGGEHGPDSCRASMRPRPDAAENVVDVGDRAAAWRRASMRPRPDAAENPPRPGSAPAEVFLASMRPRPDAAENSRCTRLGSRTRRGRFNEAAARCRGKRGAPRQPGAPRTGFNEAAARCRGKLVVAAEDKLGGLASMRPRPDAAENFIVVSASAREKFRLQ